MESRPLRNIMKQASDYDAGLLANDPRFRREVTLIHEDGSVVHYDSAFLMKVKDTTSQLGEPGDQEYWIVCFTEHHGLHVDHSTDLLIYWESERRHQPIEELP